MADNLFNPSGLFEMLKQANLLPTWNQQLPYGGSLGHFAPGINNLVALNPSDPELLKQATRFAPEIQARKNTAAHEMTHAVDHNLMEPLAQTIADKVWNKQDVTDDELRFLDAYKKVANQQIGVVGMYSRREQERNNKSYEGMIPKQINKEDRYDRYRVSPGEAIAFGVGNSSVQRVDGHENLTHFDPSKATEVSILMELYNKVPKGTREKAVKDRADSIKKQQDTETAKDYRKRYNRNFVDVFADPFAPTIK